MTKPPKAFDVWLVTADTVYKGVPYQVVAGWVGEGRLGPADQLRPAGTAAGWAAVGTSPHMADYLPRAEAPAVTVDVGPVDPTPAAGAEPAEAPDPAGVDAVYRQTKEEEDDEVDMIPLIDISMVLLVFFIIISATGALSPVAVPDMRYAGELSASADAITIAVEKAGANEVVYSVRTGTSPALPDDAELKTPEQALQRLNLMLADRARPPEVRIACDKSLPSGRVGELARDLKKLQEKGKINSFVATVNEAAKEE